MSVRFFRASTRRRGGGCSVPAPPRAAALEPPAGADAGVQGPRDVAEVGRPIVFAAFRWVGRPPDRVR